MKRLFCIALAGLLLGACRPQEEVVGEILRRPSEQGMRDRITELQAKLVAREEFENYTLAVLETKEEIRYGTYFTSGLKFDNGETSASLNHSEQVVTRAPRSKVSTVIGMSGRERPGLSYSYGHVIAVIHDQALQKEIDSVKITFNDKSQKQVPVNGSAILYLHSNDQGCCAQVDFVSKKGDILSPQALYGP